MPTISFLVDENVPNDIVLFLRDRGHTVYYVGDTFVKGSPDQVLHFAAELNGLVVLTFDKDFKRLVQQLPAGSRTSTRRSAGRISLTCTEIVAVSRIRQLISLIEAHYEFALAEDRRLILQISETTIMSSV